MARSCRSHRRRADVRVWTPAQSLGLGVLLGGLNPKNLALASAAAAGVAQLGVPTADAVVSLTVFVVPGSLTIVGPVVYYLLGGAALIAKRGSRRSPGEEAIERHDFAAVPAPVLLPTF